MVSNSESLKKIFPKTRRIRGRLRAKKFFKKKYRTGPKKGLFWLYFGVKGGLELQKWAETLGKDGPFDLKCFLC
jgi:hypothetical protein